MYKNHHALFFPRFLLLGFIFSLLHSVAMNNASAIVAGFLAFCRHVGLEPSVITVTFPACTVPIVVFTGRGTC